MATEKVVNNPVPLARPPGNIWAVKSGLLLPAILAFDLVEAAGIEPASEGLAIEASTSLAPVLFLALPAPRNEIRLRQSL